LVTETRAAALEQRREIDRFRSDFPMHGVGGVGEWATEIRDPEPFDEHALISLLRIRLPRVQKVWNPGDQVVLAAAISFDDAQLRPPPAYAVAALGESVLPTPGQVTGAAARVLHGELSTVITHVGKVHPEVVPGPRISRTKYRVPF